MASFWDELAGGTVGGVIGMSVVYPLDTIKSRYAALLLRELCFPSNECGVAIAKPGDDSRGAA